MLNSDKKDDISEVTKQWKRSCNGTCQYIFLRHYTKIISIIIKVAVSGKTIPYLNKDSKTYSKTTRPGSHEHVQVKVEPRDHSNSAFNFDETEEEHTAKRPCVGNSMGWNEHVSNHVSRVTGHAVLGTWRHQLDNELH